MQHTSTHAHHMTVVMGSSDICSRCVLSYEQHTIHTHLSSSFFCPNTSFCMDGLTLHSAGTDSCLPCIMCPLRAPSGRWRPSGASGIHRGCHRYGKVCKHMVLNRDVQRFSLNVPPTCRIWLKCNEVLVREGRWPDSHYCLVIGCQAADATLRYLKGMP